MSRLAVVERTDAWRPPEHLAPVLDLLEGSKTVELKMSVVDADHRSSVASLGIDPLEAQVRHMVFFDTPDLMLSRSGVVVRIRRIQGERGDVVVTLRPLLADQMPPRVREVPTFGVEIDATPAGFVCSGTMKAEVDDAAVTEVIAGRRPLGTLLSEEQRTLFLANAPDGLRLEELSILGPIDVLALKFTPPGSTRRIVAELWLYPDGARILQLSTRSGPTRAFDIAVETRLLLADHGIDLLAEQQTKTTSALQLLADELPAAAAAGRWEAP